MDDILTKVGLCVVGLLLCVVFKDSLEVLIDTIVGELLIAAKNILGV